MFWKCCIFDKYMKIEVFEDLEIWKEARALCKQIYIITASNAFKMDLRFRSQMRSSSGSVMDNIAEGFTRQSKKEFIQFLYVAKSSCAETRSQIYRALDYKYIDQAQQSELLLKTDLIMKKIQRLIIYLKTQLPKKQ